MPFHTQQRKMKKAGRDELPYADVKLFVGNLKFDL
jgi:hypothetical protein